MNIDICEFSLDCGDDIYYCRYGKENCPHGRCEPPRPRPQPQPMVIAPKPIVPVVVPSVDAIKIKEPRGRKPIKDWETIMPKAEEMLKQGKSWDVISSELGVSRSRLYKYRRDNNLLGVW